MTSTSLRRPCCALAATLVFAVAGCGSEGASPDVLALEVVELTSPAGPGSGEPRLAPGDGGLLMSWLEASEDGVHDLRFARFAGSAWSEPLTIASSTRFFVNWADFPSISRAPDGALWAHWLQRGEEGGYDYGVRLARSDDGGHTWGEPWTPHEDDSPTEHGFVSTVSNGDRLGFAWLDGRMYAEGEDGREATGEMTLRYREVGPGGMPGDEMLVDARVCDCCQTASAMTDAGPILVYRNRTEDEIRDIYAARLVDGVWTEGRPVADDGWHIEGCPVNGPAVAASGTDVVVAWFAAPGDQPHASVTFSSDAGATFGSPIRVDDGNPVGRVDVLLRNDGSAIVSWMERTGGEGAEVRLRQVRPDGSTTASATVSASSSARASGFPRIMETADGSLMMAWTDVTTDGGQVRVARILLD